MASPFATTLASSLTPAHVANSLLARLEPLAQASWAGSTSVLLIWPSIPWAAVATGPTNLFALNADFKAFSGPF